MRAVLSVYLFAIMAMPSLAAELDGHYRANLDEQPTELILRSQGEQVEGEYLEGRHLRLTVSGRFDGQALQAQISDPRSGQVLANMNANYANDMLNAFWVTVLPFVNTMLLMGVVTVVLSNVWTAWYGRLVVRIDGWLQRKGYLQS